MRRTGILIVSALLATGSLAACGDDDGSSTTTTTSPSTVSTTTVDPGSSTTGDGTGSSTTTTVTGEVDAKVYFARGEGLGPATRQVSGPGVARAALGALIAGPDADEAELGMTNAFPSGTKVLGLSIDEGVATVDLNDEFQAGGGSLTMQVRVAQIIFTLTQFDTVKTVDIHIDGSEVDGIGGEGVASTDLDRSDFESITPAILVESPTPGATITTPLTVSGTANTFEATYVWSITGEDGTVWANDFGTASSGTGNRGTFSFEADLGDHTGSAVIKVWEESAKDGSEINVVTIPITVD